MKKKVGLLIMAAGSYLLTAAVVYAVEVKQAENKGVPVVTQPGPVRTMSSPGGMIFDQLNLTPDQKQKMQTNKQAQNQEMQAMASSLREKNNNLQEALRNPEVTRASVLGITNEIKGLQEKMLDLRIDEAFSVKEILTPEQYTKYQQLMGARLGHIPRASKKEYSGVRASGAPAKSVPTK
jgi:Spy/CpxP family protein refolding chaperone